MQFENDMKSQLLSGYNKFTYIIAKSEQEEWYLYSVERCSFGKRIEWTTDIVKTLKFSTQLSIDTYIERVLPNVEISVIKLLNGDSALVIF